MLNSARMVGFVPIGNMARAKTFYSDTLGLPVTGEDSFAITLDANGTMVRLTQVGEHKPASFTILGWEVSNLRKAVTDLEQNGVRFEKFAGLQQDELGIWTAPGGSLVAWFKDPDGNILSLSQFA